MGKFVKIRGLCVWETERSGRISEVLQGGILGPQAGGRDDGCASELHWGAVCRSHVVPKEAAVLSLPLVQMR